jgi:hypothetical protein
VADAVNGTITFSFASDVHRQRCEGVRSEVEAALTEHAGRPITVQLMPESGRPSNQHDDEIIDINELEDAPAAGTLLDQLKTVFPGAEIIEE